MDQPNLRTAKKPLPKRFHLEEFVRLSGTDMYNDAYSSVVCARRLRDRFMVNVQTSCETQITTFVRSWILETEEDCRRKYDNVLAVVTDIRDFIEAEGLRNVLFEPMLKHALSGISADIENIYESAIPFVRNVIDPASRGNLMKNIPTIPFRVQSGPDRISEVYESTGAVQNPIPADALENQYGFAVPSHIRKERGMKDIFPAPMSKTQSTEKIVKVAAASDALKTDAKQAFIDGVKKTSDKAVAYGRGQAVAHYLEMTGAPEEEGGAFYDALRAACMDSRVVLNVSTRNLMSFLGTGEYSPITEEPSLLAKFNRYANKREQAERALGCFGLAPVYASIVFAQEGDRGYGSCGVALRDVSASSVLLNGDSFRTRNPARVDFVADPSLVLYSFEEMADCKAASIMTGMSKSDYSGGPALAMKRALDSGIEFGRCEALIFSGVNIANISRIVIPDEKQAKVVRAILHRIGKFLPVAVSANSPSFVSPAADFEPPDESPIEITSQKHFCVGDRVAMKPMPSHPRALGTIIDVVNGNVIVEWDDSRRGVYDMVEALMRIMQAPGTERPDVGIVAYAMPGMDEDSVAMLSESGVDPVTLYSIASHHLPSQRGAKGWMESMIGSIGRIGLRGSIIKGYVPVEDAAEAFAEREWIEAELPNGARLVIDLSGARPLIQAGDADEYIRPDSHPSIEIE